MILATATLLALRLALAADGRADELGELTASLARLPATDPLRAGLDLQVFRRSKLDNYVDHSRVALELEAGPEGVRVDYPRAVLKQADQELRGQTVDPEKKTPTWTALGALTLNEVAEVLDCSVSLARDLSLAKLVETRAASYQGRPARLLLLNLTPRLSKEARKHVKNAESTMSIWVGEDGLPLAAERTDRTRGTFLLLGFENVRKQSWAFGRRGNRLFALRHQVEDSASGLGQSFQNRVLSILSVR
jgi:hypothetical protein